MKFKVGEKVRIVEIHKDDAFYDRGNNRKEVIKNERDLQ